MSIGQFAKNPALKLALAASPAVAGARHDTNCQLESVPVKVDCGFRDRSYNCRYSRVDLASEETTGTYDRRSDDDHRIDGVSVFLRGNR